MNQVSESLIGKGFWCHGVGCPGQHPQHSALLLWTPEWSSQVLPFLRQEDPADPEPERL